MLPFVLSSYFNSYSLQGLFEQLGRVRTRGAARLVRRNASWPRIVALFRLVYEGSFHESLEIPAYGGELFEAGNPEGSPIERALHAFENACFDNRYSLMPDTVVLSMLDKLMRTKVRIRQGRGSTYAPMPVDFSQLSTEYIGVLYEGLLDYELRQAEPEKPVLFLAVGNEPALPLDRLEAMEDSQSRLCSKASRKSPGTTEGPMRRRKKRPSRKLKQVKRIRMSRRTQANLKRKRSNPKVKRQEGEQPSGQCVPATPQDWSGVCVTQRQRENLDTVVSSSPLPTNSVDVSSCRVSGIWSDGEGHARDRAHSTPNLSWLHQP